MQIRFTYLHKVTIIWLHLYNMAGFNTISVTFLLLFLAVLYCSAQPPFKKFEYKYSFKGPHLIQKDETVPFWQYGGRK